MEKEMVCIVCPMSCRLEIRGEIGNLTVTGNACKRGEVYANKELTDPTRMITSTVKIKGGIYNRLPVATNDEIPKGMIFTIMDEIHTVEVSTPISVGDVIIKNVCDTGVDIVATRSMK